MWLLLACAREGVRVDRDPAAEESPDPGDSAPPADCLAEGAPAGSVIQEAACAPPDPWEAQPWAAGEAWRWVGLGGASGAGFVVAGPVVLPLLDRAEDGGDVVVVVAVEGRNVVVALDGATGTERWAWEAGGVAAVAPALGDVDGDGVPEVVVALEAGVAVVSAGGQLVWDRALERAAVHAPHLADLDGDGRVEVIAGGSLLDGATGEVEARLSTSGGSGDVATGDVDGDGRQEVLYGGALYGEDGEARWAAVVGDGAWVAGAWWQADEDEETEALVLPEGAPPRVVDPDGGLVWIGEGDLVQVGPPCVGDLDGDGAAEAVWVDGSEVRAFTSDGTKRWSLWIDAPAATGCATFDFDGDGAMEVLVGDREYVYALDGEAGSVQMVWADQVSAALLAHPVVADLDGDGEAEVVVGSSSASGGGGVVALTHLGDRWAPAPPTWSAFGHAPGLVADEGGVPAVLRAGGLPNVHRGQAVVKQATASGLPDLGVRVVDACVGDCAVGPARVSFQVYNQGYAELAAGGRWEVLASGTVLAEGTLDGVPAGGALASIEVRFDPIYAWQPVLVRVAADSGSCDEADDEAVVGALCR